MTKPVYRIPSMKEINKIPPNGFNVISTFSGIGGSCLGYRMAGYKVLWANEFMEWQQNVYADNNPDSYLDERDIYTISAFEILKRIGKKVGMSIFWMALLHVKHSVQTLNQDKIGPRRKNTVTARNNTTKTCSSSTFG